MKLISLNVWGGKFYKPLIKFISQNKDTDIFCFQEVYTTKSNVENHKNILRANLLDEIIRVLPDFKSFYSVEISGFDSNPDPVDFDLTVGKSIFIKNNIKINDNDDLLLYGNRSEKSLKKDFSNLAVTLQHIDFILKNKPFTLYNIHGISYPGSKLDTKIRLEHSRKIKRFLQDKHGPKIVTGDFNLLPETQSIKIMEVGMRNLISEFNIKRTRSNLSPYSGKPNFQKFADYIFVSPEVIVKNFKVPDIKVSDHLPLYLEFE